jgi:hypothetical protein
MKKIAIAMGVLLSVSGLGCLMEAEIGAEAIDDDESLEPLWGGDGSGGNGIITGNGASALTPTLLTTLSPVAGLLTLDALNVDAVQSSELLATVLGRVFLDYAVKCALPAGQSVTASYLGTPYTFPGQVGIAPGWGSGPLSASDRRWLSACMLALVNATTTSVSVLLAGNHPALTASAGPAAAAYTLREGAFYGDIFALTPKQYACSGVGSTVARLCTESVAGISPCGYLIPGDCRGGLQNACEGLSNGYYTNCHSGLILPLLPTTTYPETITVYLQP